MAMIDPFCTPVSVEQRLHTKVCELTEENQSLRLFILSLCDRLKAQSELLTKKAEKRSN